MLACRSSEQLFPAHGSAHRYMTTYYPNIPRASAASGQCCLRLLAMSCARAALFGKGSEYRNFQQNKWLRRTENNPRQRNCAQEALLCIFRLLVRAAGGLHHVAFTRCSRSCDQAANSYRQSGILQRWICRVEQFVALHLLQFSALVINYHLLRCLRSTLCGPNTFVTRRLISAAVPYISAVLPFHREPTRMQYKHLLLLFSALGWVSAEVIHIAGERIHFTVDAANVCNVTAYGAKGDGKTNDTAPVQAAITACAATGDATVLFPAPFTFLVYPLFVPLTSNFVFQVDQGATVLFAPDTANWPASRNCISLEGGSNIAFGGGGIVNGSGNVWWPSNGFRPHMLSMQNVTSLLIMNLTWADPPNDSLVINATSAEVSNICVLAPPNPTSHNTTGIVLWCEEAYLWGVCVATGGANILAMSSNILIDSCRFGTGMGVIVAPLSSDAAMSNVTVRNSSCEGTTQCFSIQSAVGASGFVSNITFENLSLNNVGTSMGINMFASPVGAADNTTIKISGITVRNVTAVNSTAAGNFICDANAPCTDIYLEDIFHLGNIPANFTCANAYGTYNDVNPASCLLNSTSRLD
jgi:polygalacturonase